MERDAGSEQGMFVRQKILPADDLCLCNTFFTLHKRTGLL